ncbi:MULTISPECIES: UDP-N-acetylmuramate dehydrogenase [Paenibacillus]|uniref:UDP-N-acetylmuramate dehydrogenase n=1 Tax=Paenibacillus TaxID=44249 RepID=UPI002FE35C70
MTTLDLACLLRDQPLSRYSTYEIGGTATFLALPQTEDDIREVLEAARSHGLNPVFFGMGSNLLFPDQPSRESLFISTRSHRELSLSGDRMFVSAGTPMSLLALVGAEIGTGDFDFCYLLPGTLGGGIYMNAKYFEHHISDFLDTIYYVNLDDPRQGIQSITADQCEFRYKHSIFQKKNWFITGAHLKFKQFPANPHGLNPFLARLDRDKTAISSLPEFYGFYADELDRLESRLGRPLTRMRGVIDDRTGKHHFDYPSCGSVFKNNYDIGEPIGKLADRLNLRGLQYGNAMISPVHGNVIQNRGGAKAEDILYLIHKVQDAFERHYGFVPEPELVVVPS